MKILIMIDSFKGSLSSSEAGNIIKDEIEKLNPKEDITVLPVADGGEGTVAVSYTHLTLPTIAAECRSRWSPYH